jgi:hypothetical protein
MTTSHRLIAERTQQRSGGAPGSVKLPNQQRSLPTVSFSLGHNEVERMRQLAYARDVSMSQVLREALALALAYWEGDPVVVPDPDEAPDDAAPARPRPRRSRPAPPPARPRWSPDLSEPTAASNDASVHDQMRSPDAQCMRAAG